MRAARLLPLLLLTLLGAPARAYDFPFDVVKFNPSYATTLGRLVDVKASPSLTDEATLVRFAAACDRMLIDALAALRAPAPARRIKVYLHNGIGQKRRLTGNARESHLEDGAVHLVFRDAALPPGDLVPLALERSLGRCESAFLNAGLRHLYEPVHGARLPESVATSREVEIAFAEFGLHRPVRDLMRADRDARPLDERALVTARGFVRFLVERFGPEFLLKLYPGTYGFLARFEEVYGFPVEDAERQWLGELTRARLPDGRILFLRDAFERLGYKTLR